MLTTGRDKNKQRKSTAVAVCELNANNEVIPYLYTVRETSCTELARKNDKLLLALILGNENVKRVVEGEKKSLGCETARACAPARSARQIELQCSRQSRKAPFSYYLRARTYTTYSDECKHTGTRSQHTKNRRWVAERGRMGTYGHLRSVQTYVTARLRRQTD